MYDKVLTTDVIFGYIRDPYPADIQGKSFLSSSFHQLVPITSVSGIFPLIIPKTPKIDTLVYVHFGKTVFHFKLRN